MLRHRDAWAVEKRAPTKEAWAKEHAESRPPRAGAEPAARLRRSSRRVVGRCAQHPRRSSAVARQAHRQLADAEREVLIVVSKMKKYIKDRSGFNCSDAVADMLSRSRARGLRRCDSRRRARRAQDRARSRRPAAATPLARRGARAVASQWPSRSRHARLDRRPAAARIEDCDLRDVALERRARPR